MSPGVFVVLSGSEGVPVFHSSRVFPAVLSGWMFTPVQLAQLPAYLPTYKLNHTFVLINNKAMMRVGQRIR
jgi:hypothetical protein